MAISLELSLDKLSELIEREMTGAGMPARRQNGKINGRTAYKRKIDGLVIVWDSREGAAYYDGVFSYKVITSQASMFRNSVLGPNPAHLMQESFERKVAEKVQRLLEHYGFNLYRAWGGGIAEYKKA